MSVSVYLKHQSHQLVVINQKLGQPGRLSHQAVRHSSELVVGQVQGLQARETLLEHRREPGKIIPSQTEIGEAVVEVGEAEVEALLVESIV